MEKLDLAFSVFIAMHVIKHLPDSGLLSIGRKNRSGLNFDGPVKSQKSGHCERSEAISACVST